MNTKNSATWPKLLLAYSLIGIWSLASALDNPDAPGYVDDFTKRAQLYEAKIRQAPDTMRDWTTAYNEYEQFLDKELNTSYNLLARKLKGKELEALRSAQRNWVTFRDSEFDFIGTNWTRANFGSSFVISRGDYRTTLIKQRVMSLLYYLSNY